MKKINWIMLILTTLTLAVALPAVTGCKSSEAANGGSQAVQYTCPMHHEVVMNEPGVCPKCGMKLVVRK